MNKNIKIGDRVQIINPLFFQRCCYEKMPDPSSVSNNLNEPLTMLLRKLGFDKSSYIYNKVYANICDELAWGLLNLKCTPQQKTIQTQAITKYTNQAAFVRGSKTVTTGTFMFDLEDGPYFTDNLTHRILSIEMEATGNYYWIQESNVKKIHKNQKLVVKKTIETKTIHEVLQSFQEMQYISTKSNYSIDFPSLSTTTQVEIPYDQLDVFEATTKK